MTNSEFSGTAIVAASNALQMPAAFGRYELTKLLAVGGMAEVFLARSRTGGIDKPCVIKRVLPRYSTSRQFVSMFIDEARITIGLDHENIVRLFDFGQVDGAYFMALEYVEGCDLVDVLRAVKARSHGVPGPAAAFIACSVLRGLQHAHGQKDHRGRPMGIVHRDVSPQNVFLGWDGSVKIGDFGIADARNKITRTMHGAVKGKFSYMSPEQASGRELDGRSDVFAVGVVLWECLVGGRLFAADSPMETIGRVLEAPVLAPSEMRPEVDPALDEVVLRALRRPVDERYADAGAMADQLDAYLARDRYDAAQLALLLSDLELKKTGEETRVRGKAPVQPGGDNEAATVALPDDARLRDLHLELRKEKNLWTLVDIAERHAELDEAEEARSAVRLAAAVLAHRGLLVSAICALHQFRELLGEEQFRQDLESLAALRSHERAALVEIIQRVDKHHFFAHVQDADPTGLGAERTEETLAAGHAPLFGKVTAADFARLAMIAVVEERSAGSVIVREGDRGESLYAIGRGRVVVHSTSVPDDDAAPHVAAATPSAGRSGFGRVFIAALAEGEFFGEFSLLTRSPRSATVEAQSDVLLLRIARSALDGLLLGDASFREPLIEFYKERVAELLLAKNPIIGALPADARRRLLARSHLQRFRDEQIIVRQGDVGGAFFVVVHGEVEVFHDDKGFPVFLDKLRDGQFFGEIAVLRGEPRSASVRAIGDVEVIAIDASSFTDVLAENPEVRKLVDAAIELRRQSAKDRIEENARIFLGV